MDKEMIWFSFMAPSGLLMPNPFLNINSSISNNSV